MRWNQRKGLYLWWYFCPPKQVYLRRHWKRHSALGKGEAHISLEITHKIMEYVSICSFTVFLGMGAGGFMGFCQAKSPTRLCDICEVLSWFCRIPKEDRRALALISHTDIPAWLACCRGARAQRPCSYLMASHTETRCHWSLRFSSCSQFSGVSASPLLEKGGELGDCKASSRPSLLQFSYFSFLHVTWVLGLSNSGSLNDK